MNKTQKTEMAASLKDRFSKAKVALFADYKGLSATQADDLRRLLRVEEVEVKVLKNNLARQICKDGSLGDQATGLMDELVGPTLVAFGYKDPAATAKIFHKFSKDNEALRLKDSLMGDKRISAEEVEQLANMPSREALLGMVLGVMNAPARDFVGVLAAVPRSFVQVLSALERQKSEQGGS